MHDFCVGDLEFKFWIGQILQHYKLFTTVSIAMQVACIAWRVLCCGDGGHNSLHASVQYSEKTKDFEMNVH